MVVGALNDVHTHYGKFTLVHGACPTGADQMAEDWYYHHGWRYCAGREAYPARWDIEGNAAGPLRNRRMVNKGVKLGLAFPLGDSAGTWDCVRKMQGAKIPVRIYDVRSGMYRVA